jgi:hypothetical protein
MAIEFTMYIPHLSNSSISCCCCPIQLFQKFFGILFWKIFQEISQNITKKRNCPWNEHIYTYVLFDKKCNEIILGSKLFRGLGLWGHGNDSQH